MIPLQNTWQSILDWENLLLAYRKARRGKRNQAEIQQFGFDLEYELTSIRQSLLQKTYQPGGFRQFQVCDRKIRLISAAPFRDRVVQHALMNQVEPVLDLEFIPDSYASRKLKGVHVAVRQYRVWANRYAYALKIDISRYFDSMGHQILKQKLAHLIADPDVLWLFNTIIDSSPWPTHPMVVKYPDDDLMDLAQRAIGLPLGNLTSQFLGNVYLNDLDYFIKETLQVPAYLRYVDDMILLADDKTTLWDWCKQVECFLAKERIGIHPSKKMLVPVAAGLDVLGYRVFPDKTRLSRGSGYQFRRKLKHLAKAYHANRMTLTEIKPHIAGWLGHARQEPIAVPCAKPFWRRYTSARGMPLNDRRVVRGGSWNNNPQNLRSANRNRNNTDEANNNLGFRIASTPAIVPEPDHSRIIRVCRGCPYAASPGCAVLPTEEGAVFGRRWLGVTKLPLFITA